MVPSSGMVIWCVASTSSRNASNSLSARSISSTSSTHGLSRNARSTGRATSRRLGRAQVQDRAREVPVVERLGRVDPFEALQPDQRQGQGLCQRLGQRGLARARLALQQQRPVESKGEVGNSGQPLVAEVAGGGQPVPEVCWGGDGGCHVLIIPNAVGRGPPTGWRGPPTGSRGDVDVGPGREVAALDEPRRVRGEVVAGAAIA